MDFKDCIKKTNVAIVPPQTGNFYMSNNQLVNIADYIYSIIHGPSLINGKPQGTVFGVDLVVGQEKPAVSGKWDMGILLDNFVRKFVGSGYMKVTTGESTLELGTGIDPNGLAEIYSLKRVRYDPGTPLFTDYTIAFPKLEDSIGDYTCGYGFMDEDDGFFHASRRRDDKIFYGFILRKGGVETFFESNGAKMPLNYNNLNICRMDGGYLGVAPTNIYLQNVLTERFLRLHRQLYLQRTTNVKTPDLAVGAFIRNEGNTTDIKILNGSFRAGTINGGQEEDPSSVINTYSREFIAAPGTKVTVFAFKNDFEIDVYDSINGAGTTTTKLTKNTIASQLLEVKLNVLNNNKIVRVSLYVTDVDKITSGLFTPVKLGSSVLKVSDDAIVDLTGATRLESWILGKDGSNPDTLIREVDLLFPGKVAIFVYTTTSVASDFTAYIKFKARY